MTSAVARSGRAAALTALLALTAGCGLIGDPSPPAATPPGTLSPSPEPTTDSPTNPPADPEPQPTATSPLPSEPAASETDPAPSQSPDPTITPTTPGTKPTQTAKPTPTTTASPTATTKPKPPSPPADKPKPSATGSLPASLIGKDWERLPTDQKVVALTFDCGSSDTGVDRILNTLADTKTAATFFMTGDFARKFPKTAAKIGAAGYPIGNHSDKHTDYTTMKNEPIRQDLARAEAAIRTATGKIAKPLFRFPYGAREAADIRVVNGAGYVPVRWTVDTLGWKGTSGGLSADEVLQRVLDTAKPGQIVLMHVGANPNDGSTLDADALPRMIHELSARGYSFVTLEELL